MGLMDKANAWFESKISARSPFLRRLAKIFVADKDRIKLYRKLAKDIQFGMSIQKALEKQRDTFSRKSKTDFRAVMLQEVHDNLQQGHSLAKSFENYVPINDVMILEAGEKSGSLPQSMELISSLTQASKKMRSQMISAMAMPSLMFIMLILLFLVVGKKIVPTMTSVLPPSQWEGLTRSLYVVSEIVNSMWFMVILGFILIMFVAIFITLPHWTGKLRQIADKIPPWSFYRLLMGGGWILSFSSLVKSGESIMDSVKNMRRLAASGKTKNRWLNERLTAAIYYLSQGKNIGQALDLSGYKFPDEEIVVDLVSYSDQPNFDETLYQLGQEWIDEGMESFQKQSKILNSMAFMAIGGVVGWFVMGLFQLYGQIGDSFGSMGGM